jgi:hypothetical protein
MLLDGDVHRDVTVIGRVTLLRSTMNTDQIKGNWEQEKWDRLTDDDWKVVEGKRD